MSCNIKIILNYLEIDVILAIIIILFIITQFMKFTLKKENHSY